MNTRTDILDELKALSPLLAAIEKINVFSVPAGYFDSISETVLAGIQEEDIASLNGFSKDTVFEIPNGYFDSLSSNILNRIKAEQPVAASDELRVLSPMLYSIQNQNVFEVPAGYFDIVSTAILHKLKPQPAKVVAMHKRTSFFKYAIAAMVTGILALGVYKFVDKPGHNNSNQSIASLDPSIQKGIKMNEKQFDQTLDTLSEDDIANYLDKNSNDADVAELSSDIDDNNLPSPDQYLSDDKTLDNYLDDNTKQKDNN